MSYIDKLDLLLEAEGPSRRDFNKSVAAAAASSNLIPNMAGVAKVASTGATAAVSSLGKILTALDSYYSSSRKGDSVYKILSKVGRDKLIETQNFLQENPDITFDEAQETHPLAEYFSYDFGADHFCNLADFGSNYSSDDADGTFIDYDFFNGRMESTVFNKLYVDTGDNDFTLDHLEKELNGDLLKHLTTQFGGFKNFFSTLADSMEDEGSVNLAERLIKFLAAVEEKAPSLYRSLGLKVKPSDIINLKEKRARTYQQQFKGWDGKSPLKRIDDSASLNAEHAHDQFESDFLGQLREKGLVSDKFDQYVELHKDSAAKSKSIADKRGRIERQKETEERIKAPRREKKFDDEAMNRWEDEGGALGPLDEAIRKILNVIY